MNDHLLSHFNEWSLISRTTLKKISNQVELFDFWFFFFFFLNCWVLYSWKEETIWLVYKNMNSFIWNVVIVVYMGERYGGLLWLTPCQSLTTSWFFDRRCDTELVGSGCRIHWLHLGRGVRILQWVYWIWHKTIWRWDSCNAAALGNAEYTLLLLLPGTPGPEW